MLVVDSSVWIDFFNARDTAARNPNVAWTEIAGAGHYIHDDQPDAFAQAVGEFLRRA